MPCDVIAPSLIPTKPGVQRKHDTYDAIRLARLQCFRRIDVHSAMVLATELVDWRRFTSPRQLMSYFGLVPREHSSGERERRAAITKAGNSHVRHMLVQAAWKAQHRLYKLYHRLHAKRPPQIAAVAVARELVGFLWRSCRTWIAQCHRPCNHAGDAE